MSLSVPWRDRLSSVVANDPWLLLIASAGSSAPGTPKDPTPSAHAVSLTLGFVASASRTVSTPGARPFFVASSAVHMLHTEAPRLIAIVATSVPCSHPLSLWPHTVL